MTIVNRIRTPFCPPETTKNVYMVCNGDSGTDNAQNGNSDLPHRAYAATALHIVQDYLQNQFKLSDDDDDSSVGSDGREGSLDPFGDFDNDGMFDDDSFKDSVNLRRVRVRTRASNPEKPIEIIAVHDSDKGESNTCTEKQIEDANDNSFTLNEGDDIVVAVKQD